MSESAGDRRRTAFITGAAQGMGAAIAVALARDGCDVAVAALPSESLDETVAAIEKLGRRAVPVVLDLRDQGQIERAWAEAVDAFAGWAGSDPTAFEVGSDPA